MFSFLPSFSIVLLVIGAVPLYVFSGLVSLIVRQARSPLRLLRGPKSKSWFLGNLGEMFDAENNDLIERWVGEWGSSFVYKGFCGGARLMTTDTLALNHILTHTTNYPKPVFVRASLANMSGEEGVLVVEGDQHKRQRRILSASFTPSSLQDALPVFYAKSSQLAEIFLSLSKPTQTTPTPPGVDAKVVKPPRIDVLNWLGLAALDVIGEAGFGYEFSSLTNPSNELALAFASIFSAARKFRAMVILQAWFPWLRRFTESRSKEIAKSLETTRSIGAQLVQKALSTSEKNMVDNLEKKGHGKDLLSILVRSNRSEEPQKQMSQEEILCQISTFMAAGHETTSNAISWILYQLSLQGTLHIQTRLREELLSVTSSTPTIDELNGLTYLDCVLREGLRLHPPVTSTMRSAVKDDVIPLREGMKDRKGKVVHEIRVNKGDIITIPIAPVNKLKSIWGEDGHEFRPERWLEPPTHAVTTIPGVYSNLLTFLGGPRNCIGYRFALLEMKAFLFTLLRACEFELDPALVVEKKLNIVARPVVKSEPEAGNQMPLYVRACKPTN